MDRRRTRAFVGAAAAAVFAGVIGLPATPAGATDASAASMTVTPDSGLKDNQAVTVAASGLPTGLFTVEVHECNTVYAAAHGGYGANRSGCNFNLGEAAQDFIPSKPVVADVVDGLSDDRQYACNYANNGDCAMVLLGYGSDGAGGYGYSALATHPITFRPPVTGPVTIGASPTAGLHYGSPGTLSVTAGAIRDGVDGVDLIECNPAALTMYASSKDWEYKACTRLATVKVVDNTFAPYNFQYVEGGVGGMGNRPCDHTHPCEIGMAVPLDNDTDVPIGNFIPISFRPENFGTPTMKLSKSRGLVNGDVVTLAATDVPDLVRALTIYECNVKGGYNDQRCVFRYAKPGDQGGLIVHDNKTQGTTKIKAGVVGTANNGKKVYCDASTNGQCVLVAVTYPNSTYRFNSPVIKFAH